MIAIETRQLAGGVVLHAFPEGKRAVPLPVCGVWSWLQNSSSPFIVIFAVAPHSRIPVVMPDAPEHGARFGGDHRDESPRILADSAPKHAGNLRRYVRRSQAKTGYLTGGWRWAAHYGRYDGAGH